MSHQGGIATSGLGAGAITASEKEDSGIDWVITQSIPQCLPLSIDIMPYSKNDITTIYHGNAFEVLPLLDRHPARTICITDPPYGATRLEWDEKLNLEAFWKNIKRLTRCQIIFCQQPFTTDLIISNRDSFKFDMIWDKRRISGYLNANRQPLRAHESILVFGDFAYSPRLQSRKSYKKSSGSNSLCYGQHKKRAATTYTKAHYTSILRYSTRNDERGLHPTRKPLKLMQWLVESFSLENDTIIDPFAGSGTTLLAAASLGRKAIGIELSEEYCSTIIQSTLPDTPLEQMRLL